jgi:PAS domain S-box-containing protein
MLQSEQYSIPYPFMLFDSLNEGVYIVDRAWRYIYANNKAAEIQGKAREELLGNNIWERHPEVVETICYAQAHRAVEENTPVSYEVYDSLLETWFECRLYPIAEGLIILLQDISERKRQEEALREIEERMRIALKGSAITVYQQNRELRYTWLYNMHDRKVEDVVGKTDADLMEAEEAAYVTALKRRVLETGQSYQEVVKATWITGIRYFDISIEPLHNGNGEIIGVTGTSRDVTEQVELEQRKDNFISIASHELRTPITVLKGFTQLLTKQFEQQGMHEPVPTLKKMEAQSNKLARLIDELLDASKIQAGRLDYEEEPVDLDTLVHETVEMLQESNPSHVLHVSGATHVVIQGDKERLGQVLNNLIANAVKYSPQANSVNITLSTSQKAAMISVHDYGVGIAKAHHKHIFDRFYRAHNASNKSFKGLGMGLYIAYEIVKRHGGDITVESEEGKGSTFTISLPLEKEELV